MCAYILKRSSTRGLKGIPAAQRALSFIPNLYSLTQMRNPIDRAIKAMTYGAGVVGIIILVVFQLL